MYRNLNAGAIGIKGLDLPAVLALAAKTGFAGVDFSIEEVAALCDEHGLDYVRGLFDDAGRPPRPVGPARGLEQDDEREARPGRLPKLAELAAQLGCYRTATWCPSGIERPRLRRELSPGTWRAFAPSPRRWPPTGCRLGIEFLGPKTIRDRSQATTFIYTLGGHDGAGPRDRHRQRRPAARRLASLHFGRTARRIWTRSPPQDIVTVHVNDAPEGLIDGQYSRQRRRLPMETGVIDLGGFMSKLAALDYDGPVTPEPFSQTLNELARRDPPAAAERAARSMDRMWAAAFGG